MNFLRPFLARLREGFAAADREALPDERAAARESFEPHLVGIPVLACLVLVFLEYYGGARDWQPLVRAVEWVGPDTGAGLRRALTSGTYAELCQLAYWASCNVAGYLLVPALYVRWAMGRPLAEVGLSTEELTSHARLYAVLLALILPVIYAASGTGGFASTYPFYVHAGRSPLDFVLWELLQATVFLSLEFFFRGVLIHGMKHRFGAYAAVIQVIPYCMIHFGKPAPEAVGAIVAGLTLGVLSLATGSIWLGFAVHVTVAVAMDVFALAV